MSKICPKCGKVNDDITIICTRCFSFFEEENKVQEKVDVEAKLNTKQYRKDFSLTLPKPKDKQNDYSRTNYDHLFSVLDNKIIGHKRFGIDKQKEIEKIRKQSVEDYMQIINAVTSINEAIDNVNKEVKDYSKEIYENRKKIIKEDEEKARITNALLEEEKNNEVVEIKEIEEPLVTIDDNKLLDDIKEKIDLNIENSDTKETIESLEDNNEFSLGEIEKLINEANVVLEDGAIISTNNNVQVSEESKDNDIEEILPSDPVMELEVDVICAIGRVESIINNQISKEEAILAVRDNVILEPKKYEEVTFIENEEFEGEFEEKEEEKEDNYKEIKEEEYEELKEEEIKEEEKNEEAEEVEEKGEYVYKEEPKEEIVEKQEEEKRFNYKLENIFIEKEDEDVEEKEEEIINNEEEVINEEKEEEKVEETIDVDNKDIDNKQETVLEDNKDEIVTEEKEIEDAINQYYSNEEEMTDDIKDENKDDEVYYSYDDVSTSNDHVSTKTADLIDVEEKKTLINVKEKKNKVKKKNKSKGLNIFVRLLIVFIIIGICAFGVFGLRKVLKVYNLDDEIFSLNLNKDLSRKEMHRILSIEGYSIKDIDNAIENERVDFYYNALNVAYSLANNIDNIYSKKSIKSYLTDRGFSDDEVTYVMDSVDWPGFLKDNLDIFLNDETIYNKKDIINLYRKADYSEDDIKMLDRYDIWYQFAMENASFFIKKDASYEYDELIDYLLELSYTNEEIDKALNKLGIAD